jgi:phosphoribosylaminoimidazolecarboxamide formyltransferase / IMP cyclohydrolase
MRYTLVSTYNKEGLEPLIRELGSMGYRVLSTGGTADHLREMGFHISDISEYTGSPEILGGRVKTLHPKVFSGILSRRDNEDDACDLESIGAHSIDIVICNLYPFKETISKHDCNLEDAIEQIDIGGVSLLRASAKNYKDVVVLSSPSQYEEFIERIRNGRFDMQYRKELAISAFKQTTEYDNTIAQYFIDNSDSRSSGLSQVIYPRIIQSLRYGENPHQHADLYSLDLSEIPIDKIQGKKLSYNNLLDADSALSAILEFEKPASVIVKHLTPTGIAVADTIEQAYLNAFECDKISPYGGIFAFNRELDLATTEKVSKLFAEIIIAPNFSEESLSLLSKKKKLRLLTYDPQMKADGISLRSTLFGTLVQTRDMSLIESMEVVGSAPVSEIDLNELAFGMTCVKHVKSNAITLSKGFATVGIGGGQPNRVGSANIAISQAGDKTRKSYLASDAYIPFSDTVEVAHRAGVKAIIEPGGSIRDKEVIEKANELGVGLVFSGQRHFRH